MEVVEPDDSSEAKVVFWARTNDAPDFYAAADHLKDLLQMTKEALEDEFGETVTLDAQLVKIESTQGSPVGYQQGVNGMTPPFTGRPFVSSDSMSRTLTVA